MFFLVDSRRFSESMTDDMLQFLLMIMTFMMRAASTLMRFKGFFVLGLEVLC